MSPRERELVLEVLQDQTAKILDAQRLRRWSTYRRLLHERGDMIRIALAGGIAPGLALSAGTHLSHTVHNLTVMTFKCQQS
jgi:hypothetical protein